jgi:hypothetical protein
MTEGLDAGLPTSGQFLGIENDLYINGVFQYSQVSEKCFGMNGFSWGRQLQTVWCAARRRLARQILVKFLAQ